jgi:hypothetical protein
MQERAVPVAALPQMAFFPLPTPVMAEPVVFRTSVLAEPVG